MREKKRVIDKWWKRRGAREKEKKINRENDKEKESRREKKENKLILERVVERTGIDNNGCQRETMSCIYEDETIKNNKRDCMHVEDW